MSVRRLPELFADRSLAQRILLLVALPAAFGAFTGVMLGAGAGLYVGCQLIATLGGLYAGLEHRDPAEAIVRGLFGGIFFGTAVAITHEWAGGTDNGLLPQPALLPVITACFGGGLAGVGSLLRRRLDQAAS